MVSLPEASPRFKIKQSDNSISTASHTKGILQRQNNKSLHQKANSKICMTVDFAANLGCAACEYSHGHFPECVIGRINH